MNTEHARDTAIVIGGSMAGLLAARVLSDHFESVVILERDTYTNDNHPRRGVPQGQHIHGLLKCGADIITELFPNIEEDWLAHGATKVDFCKDYHAYHLGNWRIPFASGDFSFGASRPLLEWRVREHTLAIPNVNLIEGCSVKGFLTDDKRNITGIHGMKNNIQWRLKAALTVDASGRGSRTSQWLSELDYEDLPISELKMNMVECSRMFVAPESFNPEWQFMSIYDTPEGKRLGLIARIEGNRYIVTLAGKLGIEMPDDDETFLAFAGQLSQPHLYNAIAQMTPISEIVKHRTPSSLRRHYEKINMPDGLVVMGDALCSFNPIFGQGMSVAALEAVQLGNLVGDYRDSHDTMAGFSDIFQKAAAKALSPAWLAATSEDMRHPEIGVDVPLMTRVTNWYMKNLHDVCAYDKEVHRTFSHVMQMTEPIHAVFAPSIVFKVLREAIHSHEKPVQKTVRSTQQVAVVS